MQDENEKKVQHWLDQRCRPQHMSLEQRDLFLQYDKLEKRLGERRLPSAPITLCRVPKNFSDKLKSLIPLAAAIVVIVSLLWLRSVVFSSIVETQKTYDMQPQLRKQKIYNTKANKVKPMPVEQVPEYIANLSQDFVEEWHNFYRKQDFSAVLSPTKWNFAGQIQEKQDAGNKIKEQIYDVFTQVNYFLKHYTVADPSKHYRRS